VPLEFEGKWESGKERENKLGIKETFMYFLEILHIFDKKNNKLN
jgi:hypothetical protein